MKAITCGLKGDAGSIVAGKDHLRRGKPNGGTATGLFFKEWSYGFHGLVVLDEYERGREYSGKASAHCFGGKTDEMRPRLCHDGPFVTTIELERSVSDPGVVQGLMEDGAHSVLSTNEGAYKFIRANLSKHRFFRYENIDFCLVKFRNPAGMRASDENRASGRSWVMNQAAPDTRRESCRRVCGMFWQSNFDP